MKSDERLQIRLAIDSLVENPVGTSFTCPHCGNECETVLDWSGVRRNPDEERAVLFTAVPGRMAIRRADFCCASCAETWRTGHMTSRSAS